jgi:hypothetical protein
MDAGAAEKKPIIVVAPPAQTTPQRQQVASGGPQTRGGISGTPPAAFNYNVPSFLSQVT